MIETQKERNLKLVDENKITIGIEIRSEKCFNTQTDVHLYHLDITK